MKVYYAHPISIYNSPQEQRDLTLLLGLSLEVLNPNSPEIEARYKAEGMALFEPLVKSCGALAFRAFLDGSIPAGVAKEIQWAREAGLPVFELPTAIARRSMSVEATREAITNCGAR